MRPEVRIEPEDIEVTTRMGETSITVRLGPIGVWDEPVEPGEAAAYLRAAAAVLEDLG